MRQTRVARPTEAPHTKPCSMSEGQTFQPRYLSPISDECITPSFDLQGNWDAARIASSSLCLARVPSNLSTRDVSLEMQTDVSAIVASVTSIQEIRALLADVERASI